MPDAPEVTDPLDRAVLAILAALTDQWSAHKDLLTNEPAERVIKGMIRAGWVEIRGTMVIELQPMPTRLIVEGRWTGTVQRDVLDPFVALVPEWNDPGGRPKAGARTIHFTANDSRLTGEGLVAQRAVRTADGLEIALQQIRVGMQRPGHLYSETQKIERPMSGGGRGTNERDVTD